MKAGRILLGLLLGVCLVGAAWYGGWVVPPEPLSRRMAVLHVLFPAPLGGAQVQPIDCPPLKRLRLYVVCTKDCEETWRIVLVKGLRATTLADVGAAASGAAVHLRQRMNAAVGREALRLDAEGARQLLVCYLKVDGLRPTMVLPEGGRAAVEEARGQGEQAMQRLEEQLDQGDASGRIQVLPNDKGFEAELLYWDTWREGRPILQMNVLLAPDGQVRNARTVQLP